MKRVGEEDGGRGRRSRVKGHEDMIAQGREHEGEEGAKGGGETG